LFDHFQCIADTIGRIDLDLLVYVFREGVYDLRFKIQYEIDVVDDQNSFAHGYALSNFSCHSILKAILRL